MDNPTSERAQKRSKPVQPSVDPVLLGLIQALLSNPNVYPSNGESAVVLLAMKVKSEMVEAGLLD